VLSSITEARLRAAPDGLAFLAGLRLPLLDAAVGSGLPAPFADPIAFSLIGFSLTGLRSSQSSLHCGETSRSNLRAKGNWRARSLFYIPDKIGRTSSRRIITTTLAPSWHGPAFPRVALFGQADLLSKGFQPWIAAKQGQLRECERPAYPHRTLASKALQSFESAVLVAQSGKDEGL
jgi:hypothetical protein